MVSSSRVLVVGHEPQGIEALQRVLVREGYTVRTAAGRQAVLASLDDWHPQLVFTEKQMAQTDAVELCRHIRSVSKVPVIVLSDTTSEAARVEALDSGAADYVTRPYNSGELLARARAVLRRSVDDRGDPPLIVGAFRIDFSVRRVQVAGREVRLTPKEFDLLVYLASNANRVIKHRQLLTTIWGERAEEHPEYLRVFIGQLRKKLEDDPSQPRYLTTDAWVGYRLNPDG